MSDGEGNEERDDDPPFRFSLHKRHAYICGPCAGIIYTCFISIIYVPFLRGQKCFYAEVPSYNLRLNLVLHTGVVR